MFVIALLCYSCEGLITPKPEPDPEPDPNPISEPIIFSSKISDLTRANASNFETNDEISVFAVEKTPTNQYGELNSSNYASNIKYSYDNGVFASNNPITYDNDEQMLFFYAIYPYSSSVSNNFSFAVKSDQSQHSGYTDSDLMLASTVATNEEKPLLAFDHKLSNLIINIVKSDVPLSNVSITVNARNIALYNINENRIDVSGNSIDIKMGNAGQNSFKAIVVPQTFNVGKELITISVGEKNYIWTIGDAITLKSGVQTEYDLTIENDNISFDGQINPWNDDDDISAIIPPEILGELDDHMPIYSGIYPPNIEGIYLMDEPYVVFCEDEDEGGWSPGETGFTDMYIEFFEQNNNNLTVKIREQQANGEDSGHGAFIRGEGDNFTAYFETTGTNVSDYGHTIKTKRALVISGTKSYSGILDIRYSFIMLSKENDTHDELMKEGVYRVFRDYDELASKVNSFPASTNAMPNNINKGLEFLKTANFKK